MSKMKLLLDVVDDMRRLAESLQTVADSIEGNTDAVDQLDSQQSTPQPEKPKAPIITIDQVRAVLAEKSGQGKTKEVKALLYKYDAGKLSGVKPEDYPALMEEAQRL